MSARRDEARKRREAARRRDMAWGRVRDHARQPPPSARKPGRGSYDLVRDPSDRNKVVAWKRRRDVDVLVIGLVVVIILMIILGVRESL